LDGPVAAIRGVRLLHVGGSSGTLRAPRQGKGGRQMDADACAALADPRPSFGDYLLAGPPWPDELVEPINDRARDTGRAVEL
jgi:hypothetical protein